MKSFLALTLASLLAGSVLCDHWALLVAGSSGYMNYRHQADICHAYHILHNNGIPDDRIVVMMYDDIAKNPKNPFPGNIINKPHGKNLYPGVLKDYTGAEVTPEVFLKVLSGDDKGVENLIGRKGKVIKSGPNDHVFVNFADHGAPGILAFPSSELHAEELNNVILKMHKNKQYKEMVFYVEACESGSMFHRLLKDNINVYATTAANPDESSFATYYDKKRQTYLGDLYSVKWMEDSDIENLKKETLKQQFEIVKRKTNLSHVMEYGDLKISQQKVGEFQGNDTKGASRLSEGKTSEYDATIGAIPSEEVPIETLKRRAEAAEGKEAEVWGKAYRDLLRKNQETIRFFEEVAQIGSDEKSYHELLKTSLRFTDFKCYRESIEMIKSKCPGLNLVQNDYALRNLRVVANLCETDVPMERVWAAIGFVSGKSAVC